MEEIKTAETQQTQPEENISLPVEEETVSEEAKETEQQIKVPPPVVKKKRSKAQQYAFLVGAILLSGIVRAFGVHCFILPYDFAVGGVTGIATMLEEFTQISSGVFLLAINMPLLIAAFFLISKRFSIISTIGLVTQSVLLIVFRKLGVPQYTDPNAPFAPVLSAIAGGILGGIGGGIMLKIGGSCGGTDVIATFIYKHFSFTNVSWFIFFLDSLVVFASFFVYGHVLTPVMLALVEMFASARASETILYGFKAALKFEIITSSPKELSEELMQKLHRGVTAIEAKGMYTGEGKTMLVCIVRRSQMSAFQRILGRYPKTFAYISTTNEVVGEGFKSDILPD